jgi:hypothetical protein
MATVTHPLFSADATGSLAKAITYRNTNNKHTARRYTKPRRSASPLQLEIRARTKLLTQLWPTLSPEQRAAWKPQADRDNVTPLNAFYTTNWQLLKNGDPITLTPRPYPPTPLRSFHAWTFKAWSFRAATFQGTAPA